MDDREEEEVPEKNGVKVEVKVEPTGVKRKAEDSPQKPADKKVKSDKPKKGKLYIFFTALKKTFFLFSAENV